MSITLAAVQAAVAGVLVLACVERDRRTIADLAQWLEADRTGPEVHDFVSTLRREIVGSDDFLARARRDDASRARKR